jgi:predicted enzyme related to lactoylglutathione lyase
MSTATEQLITEVDFVGIHTRDLPRAAQFYGETLGLRRSVWIPERGFAEFETGNLTLSLFNAEMMGLAHHELHTPLALRVDDVAAARATLEGRGVRFLGDTIDSGVCHMALFRDPDGNTLMLHHRYAPRVTES